MLLAEEHSDVVAWLDHSKAFRIHKQSRFVNEAFPKYFKESKHTSFMRKLNWWKLKLITLVCPFLIALFYNREFGRVSKGPETGAYYHPMFQKNRKDLCSKIICGAVKLPKRNTKPTNYIPPEFTSSTADALKLAQGVHDNTMLIQELTKRVSDLSKTPMTQESSMQTSPKSEANASIDLSQSSM